MAFYDCKTNKDIANLEDIINKNKAAKANDIINFFDIYLMP